MSRILVTGGAGFIGSNFVHYLFKKEKKVKIIVVDALTYAGRMENLHGLTRPSDFAFELVNICDTESLRNILKDYAIEKVVHFAAETHVDNSIKNPYIFEETNVLGTLSLIHAIVSTDKNIYIHHVSTDEVFGDLEKEENAWTENSPYRPSSPYSASKASSDHFVRAYGRTYGLKYTISHCSNTYGMRQFPEKLIPMVIKNAIEGKDIPVYGDGKNVRDWLFVEDHCHAISVIMGSEKYGETYNIGGENQIENITLVNKICELLDIFIPKSTSYKNQIVFVGDRAGHDKRYALDTTKIKKLGWKPETKLEEGLEKTIKWYLSYFRT